MCMHERRAMSFSAIPRRATKRRVTRHRIGSIDFFEMKIRKSRDQPRNASARSLHLDRHRDRVAVIFHAENNWQLAQRGGIHRLPELTLTRCSVTKRNVSDLVALERNVL